MKSDARYGQAVILGRHGLSIVGVSTRKVHPGAYTTRKYPPRPFMGPALERARERLPDLWEAAFAGS
jgi:hypothetical protein